MASINGEKIDTNSSEVEKLNEKVSQLETTMNEKISKLETMVEALQNNNNKSKLIEKGWTTTTNNIEAIKWVLLERIPLAGNGTGKAIISFSASNNDNPTGIFNTEIRKNGIILGVEGEHSNQVTSWKRGSISSIISYDENTILDFDVYSQASIQVGYTYSILLLPD